MSIAYEYAACLLVVLCSGTMLFTLSAMGIMLWMAGGIAWRWARELTPIPNRLMARWTSELHLP
jgi:hypothetical protein